MGNRTLRKQVSSLLKEKNLPIRLFKGKVLYRNLPAQSLKSMISYLQLNIGDIVHDCDGFNHKVIGLNFYQNKRKAYHCNEFNIHIRPRKGYWLCINSAIFEDGIMSCGCGVPDPPISRDEIEKRHLQWLLKYDQNDLSEMDKLHIETLSKGNHICDENGVILKEFKSQGY